MPRIGIMGCGTVADFGHIPAIRQTHGLELAAVYDPNPERLSAVAERHRIGNAFDDLGRFFDQQLDAVVIASPPAFHLANARVAVEHGAHVLCEKPLADSEGSSRDLIDTVAAAGRQLFVGFVYRFSPVARQIGTWVKEGVVGDIRSLRLIYLWDLHGQFERTSHGEWVESPRWRGRMLEGGPMVDCGVHQIDLARWWLGDEATLDTVAAAWVVDYPAPDHVYVHLNHDRGAHTMVEMSFTYGHTAREPRSVFTYELIGTGGVIRYDREGYVLEARQGQGTIHVPGASEKNFPGMYADLARWFETGERGDLASGEDGLIATRLAVQATDMAIAIRDRRKVHIGVNIG